MKRLIIVIGLVAACVGSRADAAPCPGPGGSVFDDVDTTHPFCANITWMATHGVTSGCQILDPAHRLYCPDSPVTRGQMAKFMNQLGNSAFLQGGNAFGAPGALGTTDNQPLEVFVNNNRALRLEPAIHGFYGQNPNVIGGQVGNSVANGVVGATIGGGGGCNPGTGGSCSIAAGNQVTGDFGTVSGGQDNATTGPFATVGGGAGNTASGGDAATVGGGAGNTASGFYATVGGGLANTASGHNATVVGGAGNVAAGEYSFAGGRGATADLDGCFVWADSSVVPGGLGCGVANRVTMRGFGGFVFATGLVSNQYVGVSVLAGAGSWGSFSDRHGKDNIERVDGRRVLRQLMDVPIATWNWKTQDARIRHIGPMAQDFHAAFGVGTDDRYIETVDADGVALAALQGLYRLLEDQEREIARLKETALRVTGLERDLDAIRLRLGLR